jgi:fructose-bisphosphate aldolase class I
MTTGKRLASVGVDNTEDNRRAWRQLLYSAPGLGQYISGAIMFEETLYQSSSEGVQFVDILKSQGILPGIKVDTGLAELPGTDGETSTQGLDNLGARCEAYYKQGARFAKWRAVLRVSDAGGPSTQAILENAHGLARYAQIVQAAGLVPIVEPEVTLGPGSYSIEETAFWSERVYSHVMRLLNEYDVLLEGILLKVGFLLLLRTNSVSRVSLPCRWGRGPAAQRSPRLAVSARAGLACKAVCAHVRGGCL